VVFSKTWAATGSWCGEADAAGWPRLRAIGGLTAAALEAFAFGVAAPLLLRAKPDRVARVLEPRRAPVEPRSDDRITTTVQVTDAVLARGWPLLRRGCLTRGVTRYRMLRRAGADVALCFGAGTVDGSIEAHCWIDRDGTPLLEPEDVSRFVEMFRICRPGVVVPAA
jgi:hypothetical protein